MHKKLLSILALSILIASTLVGCGQASSNPSTLTILSITEGNVFVMKAGTDDWIEAEVGMSLEVGDTIKTGDDSGAEITFFDGSTIELQAGTEIEIASLDISTDTGATTITLQQTIGTTISRVTKLLDPASSYEIETPSGVAAVRGSTMIVQVFFGDPNYEDYTTLITNVEGIIYAIMHGVKLQVPVGRQAIMDGQLAWLIPLNDPPAAVNDSAITNEDTPVTVAAPGVLNNDSDPDIGDTLTVTSVDTSGTVGAVVAWNADGSFTYDPNGQFEYLQAGSSTTDSYNYTVSDGNGGTDTATVNITINGVNNPPIAISDTVTTDEDTAVTVAAPGVLNNDSDPDIGDTLTVTRVYNSGTVGAVTVWRDGPFTYDPDGQFEYLQVGTSTIDFFSYTVSDGNGGTDTATVTITINGVNNPPVAADDSDTTPEDTPVTIDVLNNDSDVDGDTLTVDSVTQGTNGSVINNGSNVTYTPDVSFSGTDSFTYTISDGNGGNDTATVSVDIIGPVLVKGKAYVAYEDRDGSDFDYNDFGMKMFIDEVYVGDCLKEITMEFISVKKLAGDSHDIHIRRTLSGSTTYSYTIARSTSAQGTETSAVTNASGQGTFNIVLFDTSNFTSGAKVTIHIKIINGCETYDPTPEPPRWDVASIWAHYDPYMKNRTAATEHHIGEWQPAVEPLPTGYDVPCILVIPDTNWKAPAESQCIASLYPNFDDYYDTGSPANWYN